jgi:hypothetical protein
MLITFSIVGGRLEGNELRLSRTEFNENEKWEKL